ncbi:MAG: hypothetical protein ABH821_03480 [archaeon]
MEMEKIGEYAFIIGVILAIILGFIPIEYQGTAALVLVVLGLIVGFLNIGDKETKTFLIAAIALIAASTAGLQILPYVGEYVAMILLNIAAFVAPAAVIVALKTVYSMGKGK